MVDDTPSAVESAGARMPVVLRAAIPAPRDVPVLWGRPDPRSDERPSLPGLTAIDAAAIVRAKTAVPRTQSTAVVDLRRLSR